MSSVTRLLRPDLPPSLVCRAGYDVCLFGINVKQLRERVLIGLTDTYLLVSYETRDLAGRIFDITSDDSVCRADYDTGRFEADVSSMRTEVTLGSSV